MTNGSIEPIDLLDMLKKIQGENNEKWFRSLEERKVEEALFHDNSHSRETGGENIKYYSIATKSDDFLFGWIDRHAPGKVVLDYACGNGACVIRAAKAGAALSIGIDISGGSIQNAKRAAMESKVGDNTFFLQGDCEHTGFPDNSIDVVVCAGMLHHLNLSYAFPELRRIMKPGAVAIANEGLNDNPLIKWYRNRTPELRTKFEKDHIFTHEDLIFAARFFEVRNVKYWHLFSILAVPFRNRGFFRPLFTVLSKFDDIVLEIPRVRRMAWQIMFEFVKR